MSIVLPDVQNRAILNQMTGVGGMLYNSRVQLYQNNLSPTGQNVLADFVLADFDGYSDSVAIEWGSAYENSNGQSQIVGDSKQFSCTGSLSNEIFGYLVVSGTGSGETLCYSEELASPVTLNQTGQALNVIPVMTLQEA
jgi:hypothetical protein